MTSLLPAVESVGWIQFQTEAKVSEPHQKGRNRNYIIKFEFYRCDDQHLEVSLLVNPKGLVGLEANVLKVILCSCHVTETCIMDI